MPHPTSSGGTDRQQVGTLTTNQVGTDLTLGQQINNFNHIVGSQIRFLVGNLNKKNFKSSVAELKQITALYGYESFVYLLQILFHQIDFREQKGNKDQLKLQLLGQQISEISSAPNFPTILTQAILQGLESIPEDLISFLSKVLKLPLAQELCLALGLIESSETQLQQQGIKFLKTKLSEVAQNPASLPEPILHKLLYALKTTELPQKLKNNALKSIQNQFGEQNIPILFPFIEESLMDSKRSFARELEKNGKANPVINKVANTCKASDLLEDVGYSCLATTTAAKSFLSNFPDLKENDFAMMLGVMAKTHTGIEENLTLQAFGSAEGWGNGSNDNKQQPSTWNINAFCDAVKEMYPKINWATVISKLDYPGFHLLDQKGLVLIVSVFKKMSKDPFPIETFLTNWKNILGQVSFLRFAVLAPPEVLTFATTAQIQHIDGLPANCKNVATANHAWLSLDLLEMLFRVSETEHYPLVRGMFDQPIKHCPEVLLIGIAQVNPTWTTLRNELLAILVPIFLGTHANSSIVLHRVWGIDRTIVIKGIIDTYNTNKAALSRLLDVAQDLKALSAILEAKNFTFTIDLAALASRREYLNLEKWLQERITEHGLPFIKAALSFLKERTLATRAQQEQGMAFHANNTSSPQLSPETLNTFFTTLWSKLSSLPPDLADDLKQLKSVINLNQSGTFVFPPDIEEEANSLFGKIYTGKLTIDDAINLLKSFKVSKNAREQEIFACMIHNLLDEYRFFPKYPDKELRITGVLFGSMIQHQLVSYVPLGIALRYVLDALRKPPNTKFFRFGLYALDQFKTRLVEWPQYCAQIYNIPHLRNFFDVKTYLQDVMVAASSGVTPLNAAPVPNFIPGSQSLTPDSLATQGSLGLAQPLPTSSIKEHLLASQMPMSGAIPSITPSTSPAPPGSILSGLSSSNVPTPTPTPPPLSTTPTPTTPVITPSTTPTPTPVSNPVSAPATNPTTYTSGRPAAPPGLGGVAPSMPPGLQPTPSAPPGLGDAKSVPPGLSAASAKQEPKTTAKSKETESRSEDSIQSSLPLDTMLSANTVAPPEEIVQDKIHFIMNNLSEQNLDAKLKELKDILKSEHYAYFAQYIVMKRVSIEANNHPLYLNLFEKMKSPQLNQFLLNATYDNIRLLLRSEKIKTIPTERHLLKHLGSWLGNITLAKNKPLIHKHICLKDLVYEACEEGKLIAVVPFVAKILESCKNSKIFAPPNVWLMAHIRLLKEVYNLPDLKMNPKLTIEVLCNNLGINLEEVPPSNFIATRKAKAEAKAEAELAAKMASTSLSGPGMGYGVGRTLEDEKIPDTSATSTELLAHISTYCQINPAIPFLQNPQFKKLVPHAIEKSIREIIGPVVERSVTIACITTRELIVKDFAMEPDENKMRKSAHMMVQHLASSLALVTCKEPLRVSMSNHLHTLLATIILDAPGLDQVIQTLCAENLDLACSIIEKSATEKALAETDEQLANAYAKRKLHRERAPTQAFFDLAVLGGRYPAALPEPLRPKHGGLLSQQLRVYEDFARLPRHSTLAPIRPPSAHAHEPGAKVGDSAAEQVFGSQGAPFAYGDRKSELSDIPSQLTDKLKLFMAEVEKILLRNANLPLTVLTTQSEISTLIRQIPTFIASALPREEIALSFAQDVFIRLFENDNKIYRQVYFVILESIRDVFKKITKEITAWVIYADDEKKMNKEVIAGLVQSRLISISDFDAHLYKLIDNGRNTVAVDFAVYLLRSMLDSRYGPSPFELANTLELFTKLAIAGKGPEGLSKLLEEINASGRDDKRAPREKKRFGTKEDGQPSDPLGFRELIAALFDEWIAASQQTMQPEKAIFAAFITKLQQQGIFKGEEITTRFFQICTELAIENAFSVDSQGVEVVNYQGVDAFARLIVWMIRFYFPEGANNNRIQLLTSVLTIVGRVLARDYEMNKTRFNQRPYFRLFVNLLVDLNTFDPVLEAINLQVLLTFSNKFLLLSPCRMPGFAFAWLELISHRTFMPKLLLSKSQKGWPLFQRLLVELFKFLEPYLRNAELNEPIRLIYKGTLRVLLVLLHDFPEFLCDYHFSFCDVIPTSCIQMRNLILSAFPRNMRLPDPFTPNLKVDLLPEISQPPRILSNYTHALSANNFKQDIDTYLKTRLPLSFLIDLPKRLLLSQQEAVIAGTHYNVPAINALVLYVGIQAISQLQKGSQVTSPITHSAPMDIFQHLAVELDTEGRYLFLNAIANQLRYPNNHTHYFSCVLLYLFAEAHQMEQSIILEQITRVLLERLIANRPHPWGLLITFIELIKNPRYNFWSHSFTRLSPEIERLFDSVARSCIVPAKMGEKQT